MIEGVIHLALFCAGGLAAGLGAVAAVERLVFGKGGVVRGWWVAAAAGLFAVLAAAERLCHR